MPIKSHITRRRAREQALQVLYQLDFNHEMTPEAALFYFEKHFKQDPKDESTWLDPFTQKVVSGVMTQLAEIDRKIAEVSENWRTERMSVIDRNILRIGFFEMNHCDDIPATVTINEMIELAKSFGAESSAAFVNGILDKIKAGLNCPNKAE